MIDPNEIVAARHALGRQLARYRQAAGLNQYQLAPHTHYSRSTVANVEVGLQKVPRSFWERADAVLGTGGKLTAQYDELVVLVRQQQREMAEAEVARRAARHAAANNARGALMQDSPAPAGDLVSIAQLRERQQITAAYDDVLSPARVLQALDIVTSDNADTLGVATDCLNELILHYSEKLSVSPSPEAYDDLVTIRSYAGSLVERASAERRHRSDLVVATGWLSNLLAVATSYMGDHGSALIWCVDAERRSRESGYPEIAGWAALTRAMIAYYQGRAGRSIELASNGQEVASVGTVAHAKLAAHEMRARAMLGDAEGMVQAKSRATQAIAGLPSEVATTGVFSIALAEDPPYTATSLLLVDRFQESAMVTRGVIRTAYPASSHTRNRHSSNYARTLLILGLAEAGIGHVEEAVAAGRAALGTSGLVWPTLVLAGKLDQALMRDHKDAAEVSEYHALYVDAANRASSRFQHVSPRVGPMPAQRPSPSLKGSQ